MFICTFLLFKESSSSSSVPNTNYVVPQDKASSCITHPLAEILRDLNKRIPDNSIKAGNNDDHSTFITWYHANRMLSFYAPGWCGEVRDVIFSDNRSVTVFIVSLYADQMQRHTVNQLEQYHKAVDSTQMWLLLLRRQHFAEHVLVSGLACICIINKNSGQF